MSQLPERESERLTWEDLRTHRYLEALYNSIPGLKRSPDPYSPDEDNDLSVPDEPSEGAVSSETQDPLDNTEELKKMGSLFNFLDWKGKLAYLFTLGYGTYPYEDKGKYPDSNVSQSTGAQSDTSGPSAQKGYGRYLPYAAAKRYSVSFEGDELSRLEVAERYIEPIFERDEVDFKEEHAKGVTDPLAPSLFRFTFVKERHVETQLDRLIHVFLSPILISILGLKKYKDRLANHILDFLIGKEILRGPDLTSDTQSRSAIYFNHGGTSLKTIGLNVQPDLVIGVQEWISKITNGKEEKFEVIAASLLGEVKSSSLELRANFRNVKKLLNERNSLFIEAVSVKETPDLKKLAGQAGKNYRETPKGAHTLQAKERRFSKEHEISTSGLTTPEFNKAVKLYSIITKLVTTGVHAGVPRVLLMDFNDYLFIELDREFTRNAQFCTDEYFPEIVNCEYAMFHRSEEFIKLLIIGWSLPTKEYTGCIEQFSGLVQIVLVTETREKLDSFDLEGQRSMMSGPQPPSQAPSRGSLGTVPEESTEDLGLPSAPATSGSSSSSQGHTSYQSDHEVNRRRISSQVTEGNAEEVDISQSDIETLSLSPPLPTNKKRRSRKIGPPIDAPELLTPPSSSSASSESQYFKFNTAACENYSCVILADALKQYVRHGEGYNSQTLLVDTGLFLRFIRNSNKVLEDPLGKSLLKVYDPYWADDSDADPEKAFYHYNPILSDLCTAELRAYEKLSPLMGEVIPSLYAYGTMLDVSRWVRKAYWRFTGPFLLMEHLKKKESFELSDVDEGFVRNKIIPAFKRLHSLGVVHNDIKWSNMVVTEDGDFKIIDFSHSVITDDEDNYKTEIDNIWSWFQFGDSEDSME